MNEWMNQINESKICRKERKGTRRRCSLHCFFNRWNVFIRSRTRYRYKILYKSIMHTYNYYYYINIRSMSKRKGGKERKKTTQSVKSQNGTLDRISSYPHSPTLKKPPPPLHTSNTCSNGRDTWTYPPQSESRAVPTMFSCGWGSILIGRVWSGSWRLIHRMWCDGASNLGCCWWQCWYY